MTRVSVSGSLSSLTTIFGTADRTAVQSGCYAINHTVAKAKTEVTREVATMSGLSYRATAAEIRQVMASLGSASGGVRARGGYHGVGEFAARQTAIGVSASPWGVRRVFAHSFIIAKYGGKVFVRKGAGSNLPPGVRGRFPIHQLYGPAIPKEMLHDASVRVWDRLISAELPARQLHEWVRLMGR